MGNRVYWKGKVMHFINYCESYGSFQFKKFISETSSLVQIQLKKIQTNISFEKKVKLKFTDFANYN